ncbi:MAG: aldo/keto reductase [Anaerolineae bacterium]|nr:aldo/keto reductase [Anaerolineae bacterium]
MLYTNLGRTGVKVSRLCMGTMNFGGRTAEVDAIEMVDSAIAAGINFVDTANVYGHDPQNFRVGRGRSETIVGKALKQIGKRDQIVLATKAHFPMSDDLNDTGNSRRHLITQCEASLQRLQTDYIDLYQLHHPSNDTPIDETLRALDDLIRAGKIRYIGTSSFAAWQFIEALWVSKEYGLNRFICEQPAYNLLDRRLEREFVPMAQTYGVAIIPWSPLAGGLLSGKYERGAALPEDSRYDAFWRGVEVPEAAFDVIDTVKALAQEKGCTASQLALAWVMQQPGITSAIIGPRTRKHLDDNLLAVEIQLTEDDLKRLDAAAPPGRMTVPYYGYDGFAWRKWGPHDYRW